jgi:rhodanese-related sulfurtransferase
MNLSSLAHDLCLVIGIALMSVALAGAVPAFAGDGGDGGGDGGGKSDRSAPARSGTVKSATSIMQMMGDAGERVIILDVRPKADFAKGHLRGAINLEKFDKAALGSDKSVRIVVYGANERDESAAKMVRTMAGEGFANVIWMRGGFAEWVTAQLPVSTTAQTATN